MDLGRLTCAVNSRGRACDSCNRFCPLIGAAILEPDIVSRDVSLGEGLMKVPEKLLLAQAKGEVLFVCGAGVSQAAGLPDFRCLVIEAYNQLDPTVGKVMAQLANETNSDWRSFCSDLMPSQTAEVGRFVLGEYDVVLGMLERRIDGPTPPGGTVRRAIVDVIRGAGDTPARIHHALIRLAHRGTAVSIATTNFDRLLEAAGAGLRPQPTTLSPAAMPRPTRWNEFSGVFHIHGVVPASEGQPADLVVTDQDFGDVYLRRRVVSDFVYDAARLYHLVLVGYSLNDPPMRYLLKAVAADGIHFDDIKERYAFVGDTSPDPAVLADWKGRGIIPIYYDSEDHHAQLRDGLERWAEISPPSGASTAVDGEIRRIVRQPKPLAPDSDRRMFEHLFRRAHPEERARLTHVAESAGADLSWLDLILGVIQADHQGRAP